jgi:hypothetical protein
MVKTIGDLINEARVKSGAKQYSGHDIMDLMRFDVNTKHMIVFDVLSDDGALGMKGERSRLFLSEEGYLQRSRRWITPRVYMRKNL